MTTNSNHGGNSQAGRTGLMAKLKSFFASPEQAVRDLEKSQNLGVAANDGDDDEKDKLPLDTGNPARVGMWVLGLGFGGFLLWAAFAPLDEGVPAPATVTIDTKRKPVQHLTGGIVKAVYVKEGQFVKQAEPLLELDSAATQANFETIRQRYFGLRATEGRLLAEQQGADSIAFHPDLLKASSDPMVAAAMSTQQSLFQARRSSIQAELMSIDESIRGSEASTRAYRSMLDSRRVQQKYVDEELKGLRELVREGYAPRNQLLALERTRSEIGSAIAESLGNIERSLRSISEMRQRKLFREHEYRKEVDSQLADVRSQVQADAEKYQAVSDELQRTIIRSPAEGQVVGLTTQTVGAVVGGGQKIMDIVPRDESLVLEAKVQPHLIDRVKVGEETDVRFNAFAHSPQLVVPGIVDSVSADLLTEQNGMTYYLARISITPEGMKILGNRQMHAGMPAEVVIITGERSMLTYLLRPLLKRIAVSMKEE